MNNFFSFFYEKPSGFGFNEIKRKVDKLFLDLEIKKPVDFYYDKLKVLLIRAKEANEKKNDLFKFENLYKYVKLVDFLKGHPDRCSTEDHVEVFEYNVEKSTRIQEELENMTKQRSKQSSQPHQYSRFYFILFSILFISAFKLLFVPGYYSTDFEVHRNWLSITHHTPISEWYFEKTSSHHTLDYPPLFAYFEKGLSFLYSKILPYKDSEFLLEVREDRMFYGEDRYEHKIVAYHKLSVILSDFFYFYAIFQYFKNFKYFRFIFLFWIAFPPLLMLDHIHFQYNGFIFAFFILALWNYEEKRYILCGIWFSVLLCLKHMFAYVFPAFLSVLFVVCFTSSSSYGKGATKVVAMGLIAMLVGFLSFLPFLVNERGIMENILQIKSRLFPFERGLTHAYWAPNFWCLYNLAEKVLVKLNFHGWDGMACSGKGFTGGLVGKDQGEYCVLPNVTPGVTNLLSFGTSFLLCFLRIVFHFRSTKKKSNSRHQKNVGTFLLLLECCVLSSFCFFLFSWHVHEKALLTILIPFGLLSFTEWRISSRFLSNTPKYFEDFLFFTCVVIVSLFPLLFTLFEIPIRWLILLLFVICWNQIRDTWKFDKPKKKKKVSKLGRFIQHFIFEKFYLTYGLFFLEVYTQIIHWFVFGRYQRLEFLPLIMYSCFGAIGVFFVWFKFLFKLFFL